MSIVVSYEVVLIMELRKKWGACQWLSFDKHPKFPREDLR